ncbi:MAG TPA: hypothetical protein VJ725_29645 [Thermoanaerobaculia bacterium]|nr:hypothetical protein [Thermoanaerobaculia bacterium]
MEMETTGTIRLYFMFFGFLDAFMNYTALAQGREVAWVSLVGLVRGLSYLCVGSVLTALLKRHAWLVESVLVAGLGYSFLLAYARIFLYQKPEPPAEAIWRLMSASFLTLYVLNHVRRLSFWRNPTD